MPTIKLKFSDIPRDCECCQNCRHYHQHFVYSPHNPAGFTLTYDGHCSYPRFKNRKPDNCCTYFEPAQL